MKVIQGAILVLVGALGALMYVKYKGDSPAPAPAAQAASQPAPSAAPQPVAPNPPAVEPEHPAPQPPVQEPPSKPVHKKRASVLKGNPEPIAPSESAATNPPPPTETATVQPATPAPPAPVSEPARNPEPLPPPPPRQVTLQAGTVLPVRLLDTLSSDRNHGGDTFVASLDQQLVVDGFVIAERGARVEGKIVEAHPAGRVKGLSGITLELTTLHTSDGQRVEITTESFSKTGPQSKGEDAAKIGGGAALGAIIGAIAGGGKGAAIGAGVGGAAGTGTVVATRGKPVVLSSETRLSFRLRDSVTISERRRNK